MATAKAKGMNSSATSTCKGPVAGRTEVRGTLKSLWLECVGYARGATAKEVWKNPCYLSVCDVGQEWSSLSFLNSSLLS